MNNKSHVSKALTSKRGRLRVRLLGLVVAMSLGLALSMAFDRVLGLFITDPGHASSSAGLIFPPGTTIHYVSDEFAHTVNINSLGIRGPELSPGADSIYRIAVLGDSYVYGWGVNDHDALPQLLERQLHDAGLQVEVVNLGAPGMSPKGYADIAERALPVIKPDLVIVVVLQGQDYAQLWWETQTLAERSTTVSPRELPQLVAGKVRPRLINLAQRLFPNTTNLLASNAVRPGGQEPETVSATDAQAGQQLDARRMEKRLTQTERQRFDQLSDTIKASFRAGKLNPAMIYYALKQPRYFLLTMEWNTTRGARVLDHMARQFTRIRTTADAVGANVLVVSAPYGPYVSERLYHRIQQFGYTLQPDVLNSSAPDAAIRSAAHAAQVPFKDVTTRFRSVALHTPLFYEIDGHFTPEGNRVYSRLLAPLVAAEVRKDSSQ